MRKFFELNWRRDWKRIQVRVFGFEVFEVLWAGEPKGQRHLRLCFLTMVGLHLFLNYPNHLGRYGKGWEFVASTYRYGWWLRQVCDWSFGYGGSNSVHTGGPKPNIIHRWGKWAFCNHNSVYVWPEPDYSGYDDSITEEEFESGEFDDEPATCPECGSVEQLFGDGMCCRNRDCSLGKTQRAAITRSMMDT